jgi:hypothetical protein
VSQITILIGWWWWWWSIGIGSSKALALQNELLAAFSVRDPVGFLWADAYWTCVR